MDCMKHNDNCPQTSTWSLWCCHNKQGYPTQIFHFHMNQMDYSSLTSSCSWSARLVYLSAHLPFIDVMTDWKQIFPLPFQYCQWVHAIISKQSSPWLLPQESHHANISVSVKGNDFYTNLSKLKVTLAAFRGIHFFPAKRFPHLPCLLVRKLSLKPRFCQYYSNHFVDKFVILSLLC